MTFWGVDGHGPRPDGYTGPSRQGMRHRRQTDRLPFLALLCLPCHGFSQLPSRSSCSHHTPYKGAGSFPPLFASAFLGFKLPVSTIFQFSLPHLGTPDVTTNVATTPTQQQALAVFLRPRRVTVWAYHLAFIFSYPSHLRWPNPCRLGELESCCGVEARGRGMTPCGDSIACEVCVEGVGSVLAQVAVGGALGWWDFWSEPGSGLWLLLLPARVEWKRRRRLRREEFSGAFCGVTGVERGGGLCSWQRSGSGAVGGSASPFSCTLWGWEAGVTMAEKLLDFTQPFDVGLLDATVAAFYGTGSKEEVWLSLSISLQGRLRASDVVILWLFMRRRRTDNLSQAAACISLFFFFLFHLFPYWSRWWCVVLMRGYEKGWLEDSWSLMHINILETFDLSRLQRVQKTLLNVSRRYVRFSNQPYLSKLLSKFCYLNVKALSNSSPLSKSSLLW